MSSPVRPRDEFDEHLAQVEDELHRAALLDPGPSRTPFWLLGLAGVAMIVAGGLAGLLAATLVEVLTGMFVLSIGAMLVALATGGPA